VRELARELGFEDVDEFRDAVRALRGPSSGAAGGGQNLPGSQPSQPIQPAAPQGQDWQMAVRVAAKLNLPATLIMRLQGGTEEEMEADAQQLLALFGQGNVTGAATPASPAPRVPGIPPVQANNQPVTISRAYMRANPEWVRQNRALVEAAAREKRIVD
jgi:hypothetical protein